jgi:hypothetical protein
VEDHTREVHAFTDGGINVKRVVIAERRDESVISWRDRGSPSKEKAHPERR